MSLAMGHVNAVSLKHYSYNTGNIGLIGITMDGLPGSHNINDLVQRSAKERSLGHFLILSEDLCSLNTFVNFLCYVVVAHFSW